MKKEILNLNFNTALQKKIPHKSQLTNKLMDLLVIEKEAVYRRLRGEVPFSFAEAAVISQHLCISMDELIGIQSEKKRNFSLQLTDFENPTKDDYLMWENYNHVLEIFSNHPPFIICETWNTLPFPICYKFPLLSKFYIYKWAFQTHLHLPAKAFEEFNLSDNFFSIANQSRRMYQQATENHYIFSHTIVQHLLKDLSFFRNIRLISDQEFHSLLTELEQFLDYLEDIAITGEYKESGNKVYLYVSEVNIETDFSLMSAGGNCISMLRTLVMSSAANTDELTYQCMKNWFNALKRFSTHISVSGEKERIDFFKDQREAITKYK